MNELFSDDTAPRTTARLRPDHQPTRDERDVAVRVQRPDADPAQRVLALQRTAGNRAVAAMLQRTPDGATAAPSKPWQSPRGWDALWGGGPSGGATPPPGAAMEVLDAVLRGETPDIQDLGGLLDPGLTQAMTTILANDREVTYWREAGCVEVDGGRRLPASARAHRGRRGLARAEHQMLAVRILALVCGRIAEVAYATNYGMQVVDPDGSTRWERPAPASAIASRLGIGPPDRAAGR